jgi:hypothetical protein
MTVGELRSILLDYPDSMEVAVRYDTFVIADIRDIDDRTDLQDVRVVVIDAGDRR